MLEISVNGVSYTLDEVPDEKLSELLRNRLGLTGTKVGCGEGRCGICTVLLDGKPVRSCITRASKAHGKAILTIEGLRALRPPERQEEREDLRALHPLQEAFITHGAIQCGFCTPGQLMRAHALLLENPDPSVSEIREAMNDVVCRCGSYEAIVSAIQAAAKSLRSGGEVETRAISLGKQDLTHVGKISIRPDAIAKAIGGANFTDDLHFEGMLYASILRAGVPSGILRSLDINAATASEGVKSVLTAQDLKHEHLHGVYVKDWPILVGIGERVRYVGDAIAIVTADTQRLADEAVAKIKMVIEPRQVICDPMQAAEPDTEKIHEQGNLLKKIRVGKGDVEVGFAQADFIIEHSFFTPFMEHIFMEPECSIAVPREDGGMDLYDGSQIPYADRQQVADALGLDAECVRVRGQKTGGAFGGKEDIAGQIHAALAARATGKPVKLLFTRRESMMVHPKRHATWTKVKLGAKRNGELLAAQTEIYGDTGAYASLGIAVMTRATTHSCGPYVIPNTLSECYAMYTNNPPAGAFRGFGVVQAMFGIESVMDMLAEKLGMDPLTLRRINALRKGSETNTGHHLEESVGLAECLDAVEKRLRELGVSLPWTPQEEEIENQKLITCWGLAAGFKNTGLGTGTEDSSGAILRLLPAGRLQVMTAASEVGQGMNATLQLIAAEELGIEPENINVYLMDTAITPDGGPTTASRQTYVTGNAVRKAALVLKQRIVDMLVAEGVCSADQLRFAKGGILAGSQQVEWQRVYDLMAQTPQGTSVEVRYTAPQTHSLEQGGMIHVAYGFAVQAVKVGLNPEDGDVRVLHVIAASDAGRVINPLGFQSQVEGGVVMGVGHGLMEDFKVENGFILSDRMARYAIPHMKDSPVVDSLIVEDPSSEGPYGAKGIGELVCVPTPPAISNAVYNAIGLRVDSLPVSKEKVRAWFDAQKSR
ncbi:MAG: molybdopterin cofactor-binding domain-containing protein [Anaerolineaceae bacterium]|jgi:xanthine dehydrogenase molybdenum-binding subunit